MSAEKEYISIDDAISLIGNALLASGASERQARSTAIALVSAEAEGQVGHGFSRLSDYAAQVKSGKVNGTAEPECKKNGDASFLIDAQNGFAYPALDLAIEEGTVAAKTLGCATMAIARSHHCGALSVQVEKIAKEGLVGIMVANAPAAIAPWGSNVPLFGTNPIAFAAPRADGAPLVIDLSLSKVARGKVMHAKKSGQPIPEGWALDGAGNPTTDPEAALGGSMVPIGEAKGTALALMVEILAATLTGASPSAQMSSFFTADGPSPDAGQFLMAIRPADSNQFAAGLSALLSGIEALEGARLPGTRRIAALSEAKEKGIPVPRQYLDLARELAGN